MAVHTFPTTDPRLGWFSEHDSRSLNFAVRETIGVVEERPKSWDLGLVLDQAREGACVGFGWVGELLASPKPCPTVSLPHADGYARTLYHEAQLRDGQPLPHEGTSVLAGAKVVTERGFQGGYRWAFGIEDVRDTVISTGPVVIGIPWYESMYETRPSGLMESPSGDLVGGHCLLVYGYHPHMRIAGEGWTERYRVFKWRNSWGRDYGNRGNALVRYEDLRDLLSGWGEACVPEHRNRVRF